MHDEARLVTTTSEKVRKLAESTDLETLIRRLTKVGNLNYISLTASSEDGKSFVAIFRDTIGQAPYRYMSGGDAVDVLKLALASVVAVQAEDIKKAASMPKPAAVPAKASRSARDEEDFI